MKVFLLVCLAAAAYGASLRRQLSVSDAFAAYDSNGDGTITSAELHALLVSQGYADNDGEDQEMTESVDFNGDGSVDMDEFSKVFSALSQGAKKRQLDEKDAFNAYDRNQDGSISLFETAAIIGQLGLTASDADIQAAQANADSNGDGSVTRDEFDALFNGLTNMALSEADAFAAYDANGDGKITKAELHALLASQGGDDTDAQDQEGIESTDMNGDGVVDNDEFQAIYNAVSQGSAKKRQVDENDAFNAYDRNRDGKINRVELEGVIDKLDLIATDADVDAALANADSNGDGQVTRDEFDVIFNAVANFSPSDLSEDDAFAQYDSNGDGKITKDELAAFLTANGYDASNDGADKGMIESLDTNGDGAVDKSEFDFIYQDIISGAADKPGKLDEKDAFNAYDRNQDGSISVLETAAVIGELGLTASDADILAAQANADADGDGKVSRAEFDALFNGMVQMALSEADAFAAYDTNGDGKITKAELHALLASQGDDDTDAQDQEGIESTDMNGDGVVDNDEFQAIYNAVSQGAGAKKRQLDENDAFNAYDRNRDGSISDVEAADVIDDLDLVATDDQVKAALATADANGDGSVTRDEFDAIYNGFANLSPDSLPEGDAFATYDSNGDGLITEPEAEAYLSSQGFDVSNSDADKVMVASLDVNGDGGVDKSEFDFIYQNIINGADKKRQLDENDAFNAYDRNQDGSISLFEAAAVIGQLGLTASDDAISQAMNSADANGDGKVTRDEFDTIFNSVAAF